MTSSDNKNNRRERNSYRGTLVASVETDGIAYLIGTAGKNGSLAFSTFKDENDFRKFQRVMREYMPPSNNKFTTLIYTGKPKLHPAESVDENLLPMDSGQINVITVETDGPLLSFISCQGPGAKAWRKAGISVREKKKPSAPGIPDKFEVENLKDILDNSIILEFGLSNKVH